MFTISSLETGQLLDRDDFIAIHVKTIAAILLATPGYCLRTLDIGELDPLLERVLNNNNSDFCAKLIFSIEMKSVRFD